MGAECSVPCAASSRYERARGSASLPSQEAEWYQRKGRSASLTMPCFAIHLPKTRSVCSKTKRGVCSRLPAVRVERHADITFCDAESALEANHSRDAVPSPVLIARMAHTVQPAAPQSMRQAGNNLTGGGGTPTHTGTSDHNASGLDPRGNASEAVKPADESGAMYVEDAASLAATSTETGGNSAHPAQNQSGIEASTFRCLSFSDRLSSLPTLLTPTDDEDITCLQPTQHARGSDVYG